MKRIALALGLMAVAAFGGADAQNVPRTAVCTAGNSERATVGAIAADPAAWTGRCVVVEGLYSNERVFADIDAIYGVNDHVVGGFVDGLGALRGAWRGEFVGRVMDCAAAEETLLTAQLRAPGISLHERVLGCVKQEGPFLMFMSHGELSPSGLTRRMPGAKGGDLTVAPGGWDHTAAVTQRADAFAAAMRSGDVAALAALLGDAYRAERLLADDSSALMLLKKDAGAPVLFMDRDSGADEIAAEACWCTQQSCGKLWPIDSRDADNEPTRPYACLRVEGVKRDGSWRYRLDASHDVSGLPEPKR